MNVGTIVEADYDQGAAGALTPKRSGRLRARGRLLGEVENTFHRDPEGGRLPSVFAGEILKYEAPGGRSLRPVSARTPQIPRCRPRGWQISAVDDPAARVRALLAARCLACAAESVREGWRSSNGARCRPGRGLLVETFPRAAKILPRLLSAFEGRRCAPDTWHVADAPAGAGASSSTRFRRNEYALAVGAWAMSYLRSRAR
jgi:hypothetical protein